MRIFCSILISAVFLITVFAGPALADEIKPYKVALVIGDQWDDPMSVLVNIRSIKSPDGNSNVCVSKDFSSLIVMLKGWGIPFEIIRLDQEFMDINRFVGPDGKARIGCIVWDADQGSRILPQRYEVLRQAVNEYGISLIALGDRIKEPIIQELLGVEYTGCDQSDEKLRRLGGHFITNGLADELDGIEKSTDKKKRVQVKVIDAKSIITQGQQPQATVRQLSSGARVVWIGSDVERLFSYQDCRSLFRRAITWSIGYTFFKTWENTAWMFLDDPGATCNSWLERWHYPTLTEEQIVKNLIEPLKKNNSVLVIDVVPGFVNDELKRVELSFQRKFVDEFGTLQDYPSTLRGLIKGVKAGVIEIQCHGLTHMQPDLYSAPGPWFGSELKGERAEVGWYREFGDTRRKKEIPAAEALWRMKTGIRWIEYLFGVTPLGFIAGGGGNSTSYPRNTLRLAAKAGFGLHIWKGGYLGEDMAFCGWDFEGTLESPLVVYAPPDHHDRGIVQNPKGFLEVFKKHPNVQWIGLNEYVAYLHSEVSGGREKELTLQLNYDAHYCKYFEKHKSQWKLMVSDWLGKKLGSPRIIVDGKTVMKKVDLTRELKIEIPSGLGSHSIQIKR